MPDPPPFLHVLFPTIYLRQCLIGALLWQIPSAGARLTPRAQTSHRASLPEQEAGASTVLQTG